MQKQLLNQNETFVAGACRIRDFLFV